MWKVQRSMYKKVYLLKRYLSIAILFLLVISLLSGCNQEKKEMVSKNGFFFDTMISIKILEEEDRGTKLLEACWSMCEKYEKIFSRTREDSELYQLNHRDTQEVQVSEDLFQLFSYGKACYDRTDGKFDLSVAPLSDLWDFKGDSRWNRICKVRLKTWIFRGYIWRSRIRFCLKIRIRCWMSGHWQKVILRID